MKPRRKYHGEEPHKIALEQQHKAFTLVHKYLTRSKKRQAKYANKHAKNVEYNVGDPVYYENFNQGKRLNGWYPYYRIIKKTSPVNFVIKNQLDGSTENVHVENIRLANIDVWPIPTSGSEKRIRKAAYAVPPTDSSSDSSNESSEEEKSRDTVIKHYRNERSESEDEDDIPLLKLSKRIRNQEKHMCETDEPAEAGPSDEDSLNSDSLLSDREEEPIHNQIPQEKPEEMLIDEVQTSPIANFLSQTRSQEHNDKSKKVINLLTAVVDML